MNIDLLTDIFSRFSCARILVLGDLMIDEYLWGSVDRVSPEAPVQVVNVLREARTLGGAGNVIANLAALGGNVDVAGVIGDDSGAQWLLDQIDALGAGHECLIRDPGRLTTKKTRVVAVNQQVVRIDRETRKPITNQQEGILFDYVRKGIERWHAIVLSDYGKGLLTESFLEKAISLGREKGIRVIIDPKGVNYKRYRGAGLITPNKKEAIQGMGLENNKDWDIKGIGQNMIKELDLKSLVITLGPEGMCVFSPGDEPRLIHTKAREVYDVSGAGDTVVAAITLCLATGTELVKAAEVANLAAGVVVGKVGTATATQAEILAYLDSGYIMSSKIIRDRAALARLIAAHRQRGEKVVFTNGCFDLIHFGHIKLLHEAKSFGDILMVGLNTDESVRRLKGPSRPCLGEEERAHILASLSCVDYLTLFDEDTPLELIKQLKPDILVKGSDYSKDQVVGSDIVDAYGGQIRLVELAENFSTSRLIQKILDQHNGKL
ncbi:D-glycero-beta-D-manno-heptose-7-phosphate kinase [bacterium]|nr:D-glycero-beta-D-manno-heptose-7-phosphate kinase [bacterium]